jgi:5-methylcytosine-specific restriction protein A
VLPPRDAPGMPHRPPHSCVVPGCPELVRRGARCTDHARALQAEADSLRPSASRRGYDAAWRRIRLDHLRRHPLCIDCQREGRTVAATDVDHRVPLRRGGTNDPANLQSLCHRHHSSKTALEDGRFGRRHARSPR